MKDDLFQSINMAVIMVNEDIILKTPFCSTVMPLMKWLTM